MRPTFAVISIALLSVAAPARAKRGPINFIAFDFSGYNDAAIARWNSAHPDERVNLVNPWRAFGESDRNLRVLRESRGWCVAAVDVVWVGELADAGALRTLRDGDYDLPQMFPATVRSARRNGRLVGVPWITDSGLFYYRKDLLDAAGLAVPRTWDEMKDACRVVQATQDIGCYATQLASYEGGTCNFVEAIGGAGDRVLNDDGTIALGAGAITGLSRLVDGFTQGYIAPETRSFTEEDTRTAFQTGRLIFARNWPYMWWASSNPDGFCEDGFCFPGSQVVGKYDVAQLPGEAGPGTGVLGGHHLGIGSQCAHDESARDFIRFLTSRAEQRDLAFYGSTPVLTDLYDDPELVEATPYFPVLKRVLLSAVYRPVTAHYADVSRALYEEAAAAMRGDESAADAIAAMRRRIAAILSQ